MTGMRSGDRAVGISDALGGWLTKSSTTGATTNAKAHPHSIPTFAKNDIVQLPDPLLPLQGAVAAERRKLHLS